VESYEVLGEAEQMMIFQNVDNMYVFNVIFAIPQTLEATPRNTPRRPATPQHHNATTPCVI
jgi:hypothetical protein